MTVYVKPFKCRPLSELRNMKISEWTRDELSTFRKFKSGSSIDRFIQEWEQACNRLNPNRKKMKYDW